jgi:HlyD family secretion protein
MRRRTEEAERRARGKTTGHFPILAISPVLALLVWALSGCGEDSGGPNPSGTLEATEVDLAPALAAKVLVVRADLGDRVAAGDTLVILDTELLVLQRAQAEANRQSLGAQRRAAEEDRKQAARALALAETTLKRVRTLHTEGSASEQQVDDAEAKRDMVGSQEAAARHRVEFVEAEMEKLAAALAVFDRQIRDGVLLAPSEGTVLLRSVEPGETAVPGRTALRIADLSRLELRVYLGEREMDRVKIGETLPIAVDAIEARELAGTVVWISSEAEFTPKNVQTRNAREQLVYAVKLRVPNPDGVLSIGMPAEVRLPR